MRSPRRLRHPLVPAALGIGAGTLYANFVLDWAHRGPASLGHAVSELAAPGEHRAWVYRAGELGCAAIVLSLLPMARAGLPPGLGREAVTGATAAFAGASALAGVVPTPCGPGLTHLLDGVDQRPRSDVHDGASVVADAALYLGVGAAWVATRRRGPRWIHRAASTVLLLGAASSAVFARARPHADRRWVAGISQRVDILTISAWLCCLGVLASRARVTAISGREPS